MPARRLLELIRSSPNRGDMHIFLGHPLSDALDKTTVEPGGAFSPGVWTCGISLWLVHGKQIASPDLLDAANISFTYALDAAPPIARSAWSAFGAVDVQTDIAHLGEPLTYGVDFVRHTFKASNAFVLAAHIVVRDVGPAGGPITAMSWSAGSRTLSLEGGPRISALHPEATCTIAEGIAIIHVPVRLRSGEPAHIDLRVEHDVPAAPFGTRPRSPHAHLDVESAFDAARRDWTSQLPARILAPDPRINRVWQRCAYHVLAAMECGQPRIGAVNYPHFWMRDGVIVLRALDIIGRHDLARLGMRHLAPTYFSGGFGAESDAPGEGIWALLQHALITRDILFLREVFPHIQGRVEWIFRMLTAKETIREVGHNRIPFYADAPGINILCMPAVDGLVHGRMDWHSPDFYINCWCCAGLLHAATAADLLSRSELAARWREHALELEQAIAAKLLPKLGNDRDSCIAPHPTGLRVGGLAQLKERFGPHYRAKHLNPDGTRKREPLWTYFEAASIHNAILLGFIDEAWMNLDGMLSDGPYDVTAYCEGLPGSNEFLPFRNGEKRRGWLGPSAIAGNMPHNWTNGEMLLLLRDLFVDDSGDELLLGQGVPARWLKTPGNVFGVENLPTRHGPISYRATVGPDGKADLQIQTTAAYRALFPCRELTEKLKS